MSQAVSKLIRREQNSLETSQPKDLGCRANVISPCAVGAPLTHWANPSGSRRLLPVLGCKVSLLPSLSSLHGRLIGTILRPEPCAPGALAAQ